MTSSTIIPGQINVIKRDGSRVSFDPVKIEAAIRKAFIAVEGQEASGSGRVREQSEKIANMVVATFRGRMPSGGVIHIEEIQDQVELNLMRLGEQKVSRAYVLYRERQAELRAQSAVVVAGSLGDSVIHVVNADGVKSELDKVRMFTIVSEACHGLETVDAQAVYDEALRNMFDGMKASDVNVSLVMASRTMIESEPDYSYVAARLLLDRLRSDTLNFFGVAENATQADMAEYYPVVFSSAIMHGVQRGLMSPRLMDYNLSMLADAIKPELDEKFTYLGLQTLEDRYFIHDNDIRIELPQVFFMRVAMGLAINEPDRNASAIAFYTLLSSFDYMSSTPTLFNAGTMHQQLSSCYLSTIPDDLFGIYNAMRDDAMLSKFAGGLGNDWTPVRALGSHIKGTNGKSQGIIPFLKVANDTAVAVNQGGKRKGAMCAYLETWHLDMEEFMDLRKNTGDDRRRTHDMNTANWIPDLFMKRVFQDGSWTLFSPNDVPDLHDLYGKAFESRYEEYEAMAASGAIQLSKVVSAKELWRKMLGMLFETGHPWITFKDPCNIRSPQQHAGVVHSSNLCTEITLNTKADEEIAVCNLGSVNLANHIVNGKLDTEKLANTVRLAVRMLDLVIDINYYPVEAAKTSNMRHRPVGLGLMGFQDALYLQRIPYGSQEAVEFADISMELISYYAIQASSDLAVERGRYSSFEGSLWSKGILPIDSIEMLANERGADYLRMDTTERLDWDSLRETVMRQGMRNSNVMAIAPTATISNITGVTQSIEPTYKNLYVKSNLSGEFTIINPYLVHDLKSLGLWDSVMINDLKHYEGSLTKIDRIPDDIKALYATAFEVDPRWIVEAASRRQKWLDQAQSLNLYISDANGKKLDVTYRMAWFSGLKTTYYLRALAATSTEKSTVTTGTLNKVSAFTQTDEAEVQAPVCNMEEGCESCQ